jgi:hypothetical protein
MRHQTIKCPDLETFLKVIAGLTMQGLGFDANADTLVITLNGAF